MGDQRPALIQPGGLPVFFSSEGPMAYMSLTRSEIPKDATLMGEVSSRSCQFSLSIPLSASFRPTSVSGAVGNGTYAKILREMERDHPGLRGIYNVKVDLHTITILGIFGKLCTEITAEGYK
jgi:hypothetical protein